MKQENIQTKQEMLPIVERWEQSGMSMRAFSESGVISYEKLRYWKNKLRSSEQTTRHKSPQQEKDIPEFISIEVSTNVDDFSGLQLTYPNQVKITCLSGIELSTLKSLIKLF